MKILKKWGILFVSIFFIIAIVIIALFSKKSIDELKAAVAERDSQISTLESSITEIGAMTTGYVLNTDVRAGEIVSLDYFDQVTVPEKLILGLITDVSQLENSYFRTSLQQGTVLTTEDINYTEVLDSERYMDLYLDQLPIGVQAGDIIDIRISFTYGEDFIALSGKKIEEINSGVLKVKLNENEIVVYNSLLLDRLLYAGTQVYAVTYVDAGSQDVAETFYPINSMQSDLLLENPNALELSKQEVILKRQLVEAKLNPNGLTTTEGLTEEEIENKLETLESKIEDLRENTQDRVANAHEVVEERRAIEAQRAAEAAAEAESGSSSSW